MLLQESRSLIPSRQAFFQTAFIFIAQPLLVYIACYVSDDEFFYIKILSKLAIMSFFGSIYFYLALFNLVPDPAGIFSPEFTSISDVTIVIRNTSIYTNSLVASGVGLVHACASGFMFHQSRKRIYLLLLMMSLFVIFATLSRRGFVPAFLVMAGVYYSMNYRVKFQAAILFLLLSSYSIFFYGNFVAILISRILSGLDFSGEDSGNISRIMLIKKGLMVALENPFGSGFGTLSSIGKEHSVILESEGFITVTESFYVGFVGEVGWVFCIPLFFIAFKFISEVDRQYRSFFIYPFMIESIMGLGLLNPTISLALAVCVFSASTKAKSASSLGNKFSLH